MQFLKQIFTWWNGQSLNTRFYTWRKGTFVGEDELGNRYYKAKSAVPDSIPERRWVIYKGYSDGSKVGPGWHGWLHHRVDVAPVQENYAPREWQKPHQENLTGTSGAYHPPGSIAVGGKPMKRVPDYKAWRPE
ncbi:NADH:ubiquinone oxidoreductase subunit NDUFA12 [Aestuariivirga litoralis]|uniref:NADH:ubiquinone oxidoreductase subunit NDUFA12 n=1 Tax=Aestuariivirga litoralis TaxID=2650924 RepID=UPI0018C7743D|nr:NADH:ubiquinone oxidoreductase subunit NDUFA12 [Aestuariivirga litoralis]MBG1231916.1 NADH:ubiquinone oxidoreductase subunit NDUFA12 [Aestuariivirga litoralis]